MPAFSEIKSHARIATIYHPTCTTQRKCVVDNLYSKRVSYPTGASTVRLLADCPRRTSSVQKGTQRAQEGRKKHERGAS